MTLQEAISRFGESTKSKLSSPVVSGDPEDQLRAAPLETLIANIAILLGIDPSKVIAIGETSLSDLKTRPDYSVTVHGAQVGYIEVKAPGKGANPERFKDQHDKTQWGKLQLLPNLIYTDGNEFSLWQDGVLVHEIVRLEGDVATSGKALKAPLKLLAIFDSFLNWAPIPPRDVQELAKISARLCRFLREEVTEQLQNNNPALLSLRTGWQKMLFPEATDIQFADGYAQAVTFGLLVARARGLTLKKGLAEAAKSLGTTNSLIGAALRVLTEEVQNEQSLKTSIATMTRVLDVVDWELISKGNTEAWLYFYEDFLAVYDKELRRRTGSYYTPPQVVEAMVNMVNEALISAKRFDLPRGLADSNVTVADPAVGTGTYLLGVLRKIAEIVNNSIGEGAIAQEINEALLRLFGFEIQLGPFAVAQLRIFAEVVDLVGRAPNNPIGIFVTDTLGNPYAEEEWLPNSYAPIAESRQQANVIKKDIPITVVIGNPPYKEKAKGLGGWVEGGGLNDKGILSDWIPPASWGVSTHAKHLRNLYVYFWRWATWKVFDQQAKDDTGIVCFITVAGFLNGPGFEKMRQDLREKCDEIWVIDCSPEGHQPNVPTRIFQGVQQPVCIVMAARYNKDKKEPAIVRFRSLSKGPRDGKFAELATVKLGEDKWEHCSSEGRAPFLPEATGEWSTFPPIENFFIYDGSGVMPGRTWIIAPDSQSLKRRWDALIHASDSEKEVLFHPHMRNNQLGDKYVSKFVKDGLPGHEHRETSVAKDTGSLLKPVKYGYRSFDRQWIIPDSRLINQPNPTLWSILSNKQVFLTSLQAHSPTSGPGLTITGNIPDLDRYHGRGGRVFPLWRDATGSESNILPALVDFLCRQFGSDLTSEDVFAYISCISSHPEYTARFHNDLKQPGLRIPLTASSDLFKEAAAAGRRVIWLHTYGERFADSSNSQPNGTPRVSGHGPTMPADGAITDTELPETMEYDPGTRKLHIGQGYIANVSKAVWEYEVSGKNILRQWFSSRRKDRTRPIIGDRRQPSKLGDIQPDRWLSEYTLDLIDLLNVLTLVVEMEPIQKSLLSRICDGKLFDLRELETKKAFERDKKSVRKIGKEPTLEFD